VGEESSESWLLLLPIAKNFVEVLKEKVLTLSTEFFGFFRLCLQKTQFSSFQCNIGEHAGLPQGLSHLIATVVRRNLFHFSNR
jgi:hypothetical protein